jgi:hypothetical protein
MIEYEKLLLSPVERRIIENSNLTQDWVEAACGKQHLKTLNGILNRIDELLDNYMKEYGSELARGGTVITFGGYLQKAIVPHPPEKE